MTSYEERERLTDARLADLVRAVVNSDIADRAEKYQTAIDHINALDKHAATLRDMVTEAREAARKALSVADYLDEKF